MKTEQPKGIVLKSEIRKQKISHYPYHIITDTYSHEPEYHFVIAVDYATECSVLAIYPFDKDMNKLTMCGITIANILPKKYICTLKVLELKYKLTSVGIVILSAQFVLGYRTGQVTLIEYRDKQCKMIVRLNRTLKTEGLLSKTSSFFFGDEESYSVYLKQPIKTFKIQTRYLDYRYSYLVGNQMVLMKNINQNNEKNLFQAGQNNTAEAFSFHHDLNQPVQKGHLSMFGCEQYFAIRDNKGKTSMIKFNHQVSSYQFLSKQRNEMAVSLSTKQMILMVDLNKFVLNRKILTQIDIRRLSSFTHKEEQYLAIMVYDNYVILYSVNTEQYCKLVGHRSFVANIAFNSQLNMIVSGGMDHRISLIRIDTIKEKCWCKAIEVGNNIKIEDNEYPPMRFPDIYSLGQYNNVRTNLHSYGFADISEFNQHYCLPTYDSKVMVYTYIL